MERILVTGGAGYIGSHFALLAAERGYDVIIVDNLSTGHRELARFGRLHTLDLRDTHTLTHVLKTENPTAVVHFAAFSQVAESMLDPLKYFDNNIHSTTSLLTAMAATGCERIVFSSSAAVYGAPQADTIGEDQPLRPINPYGQSKRICEEILQTAAERLHLRVACLRYFNVIGQDPQERVFEWHEPETHVVPNLIKAAREGRPFRLYGTSHATPDGTAIRDYVDVLDLAHVHIKALERLKTHPRLVSNVGRGRGTSVLELIAACRNALGLEPRLEVRPERPGDPPRLVADDSHLRAWCPDLRFKSLEESLSTLKPLWDHKNQELGLS